MSFLSTMLNSAVVGSALATQEEPNDPHLIDLGEATLEWLESFLAKFRVASATPRTILEAQKWFLSEKLGVSVSDLTVSPSLGVRFEVDSLNRINLTTLLAATIALDASRFRFSGVDGVLNQQPYSEPSPYIEVNFR